MKKLIISALILLLVGAAGTAVYGSQGISMNTAKVHEKETVESDGIEKINITSSSTDILVTPTDQEDITIEFSGEVSEKLKDAFALEVSESGGTLDVKLDQKNKLQLSFFTISHYKRLEIRIPANKLSRISVQASSGDINVEGIQADAIEVKAASGDIKVMDTDAAEMLKIETASGDILVQQNQAESIQLSAASGDITVEPGDIDFAIDFKSSSGDGTVELEGISFSERSEHRVLGQMGTGDHEIKVRTASGDFNIR